ncbi:MULTISPECIES: DUF1302 family protein [unclassified Pseudomonas]|uniref:DUF1302 domain-containing protein n=1 Tax=unclassified Pseudomonas TaxID=196821 RepID=UPI002456067D|nr:MULTISPECIES: DUF1302 family protein [unclassified Pseudomonas]
MNVQKSSNDHLAIPARIGAKISVGSSVLLLAASAHGIELGSNPDLQIKWDNTLAYTIGARVKDADRRIATNVNFDESDNLFSDAGDVVTNRISVLSEFDTVYKENYGFRVSASAWKDFAYDNSSSTASGDFIPGVPYRELASYDNRRYSSYTKRNYVQGAEILDAFVFGGFDLGDHRVDLKLGQLMQYWGNSIFQGFHSISYSQSPLDLGKALANPGARLNELFLPREQIAGQIQLTPDLSLAAQYFFGWDHDRLPEGGTYLGFADFLFNGPDKAFLGQFDPVTGAPVLVRRSSAFEPDDNNGNFGLALRWSPEFLRGTVGAYYRHFDETQPWAPLLGVDPSTGGLNYHLAYAKGVDMFALSLDKQIGDYSFGFELSHRRNTALMSTTGPLPSDLSGKEGARGNTVHAIANVAIGLTPTRFYDTGTALVELSWGHLLSVTENKELYNGEGTAACRRKWDGCSTDDVVNLAFQFEPQWLQPIAGVDLSLPISGTYGVYGNGATLSSGYQGSMNYSVGLSADIQRQYKVKLAYNGYYYRPGSQASYTPGGPEHYESGNGYYWLNDRDWVSLTFQATF